ncbi:hypothetical protein KQX54_008650 [Cotesia glomerata]|uniref:Uncharacterized protein n=1 Tax=Cotesia glomerata TaxID=32391 RepID=A0AAV7IRC6_COTGL|nr:hypothetical protein KQX54_008650 [Cotesia glomerata]
MTLSSQEEIKELIPKAGLRVKLLKKYQEQKQLQVLNVSQTQTTVASDILLDIPASFPSTSGPVLTEEEAILLKLISAENDLAGSQHKVVLDTSEVDNSRPESVNEDPPLKKRKLSSIDYVDLQELLNDHPLGPSVISHYNAFSELDNRIQGRLCDIVILFYIRRYGMVLTEKNLEKLAQDFIKCFPNECIESYYIASESKKNSKTGKAIGAKGKLVNSYKNNCTWIREGLQWEEIGKAKAQNSVNAAIHTVTDVDDTELIDSKAWLVTNRDKENLLMHWELCYEQRRKEINSNKFKGITEIFEDWPVLKENIGCDLFFQDKSENLIIEDLKLLAQPNLGEDSIHILQAKILIFLLAPKSNKAINKSAKNNGGFWRPDAREAQADVFVHVKIAGDIEKVVRKKCKKYGKLGLHMQPFIIIVGQDLQSITSFYVRVDSVQYEVGSFLKCLEIIQKLSRIFKVSYSLASENFWYFVQGGICEITTKEDTKIPSVLDLINKLKRRKNEV